MDFLVLLHVFVNIDMYKSFLLLNEFVTMDSVQ